MWDPDPLPWLVDFSRAGVRPWELDRLTFDDYVTFKVAFRSDPMGGA